MCLVIVCPYQAVTQVGQEMIDRKKTEYPETGRDQCRRKATKMGAGSK